MGSPDNQTDFPTLENEAGITPSERDEIRTHIEKVATENRIPVEAAQFSLTGARQGLLLPSIVNAAAALVIVAVILVLSFVFRGNEHRLQTQATQYASVEGKLIRELRQQSNQQLSAKEKEIEEVRTKVRELEQEQKSLAETYSQKLKQKEEELRQKQAQDVTTERARLVSAGIQSADIERRMAKYEAERKAFYEKQLADYRKQLDAERTQLQADITRLRAEYGSRLEQLEKERRQIVTDYQQKEVTLRTQLEQRTQVLDRLREQTTVNLESAQRELARLGQQQERVQSVQNQIDGQVGRIGQALSAGQADAALSQVRSLQAYLQQSSVRSIPQLADRLRSESFLLDQLGAFLEDRVKAQAAAAGQSLTNELELLGRVRTLSQQAAALPAGQARLDAYRQLVASIPEVQSASTALVDAAVKQAADDLAKKMRDETERNTKAAIQLMGTGDYAAALARYKDALNASPAIAPDTTKVLSDLLLLGYSMSDYVRTGKKSPGTDALAAQSGLDLSAQRAAFLAGTEGSISAAVTAARASADQQVAAAVAAQKNQLQSQIDEADKRLQDLQKQQNAELDAIARKAGTTRADLSRRLDALLAFEAQVTNAKAAYKKYVDQEQAARQANPQDPTTASRQELNKFLQGDTVRQLFSDVAVRVNALYTATQNAGSSAALADAAEIVSTVAKQPSIKASRAQLKSEIENAKGNDRLVAILQAVDDALARAQ
jgi:hypothetical protein